MSTTKNYAGYTIKFTNDGLLVFTPEGAQLVGGVAQSLQIAVNWIEDHIDEQEREVEALIASENNR